jgi:hypothetical protein
MFSHWLPLFFSSQIAIFELPETERECCQYQVDATDKQISAGGRQTSTRFDERSEASELCRADEPLAQISLCMNCMG